MVLFLNAFAFHWEWLLLIIKRISDVLIVRLLWEMLSLDLIR